MKQHLFLIIFLLTGLLSFAQDDSTPEHKKQVPHLATITTMDGKTVKGWLYKLMDDKIILLPAKHKKFSFTELANPDPNANEIGVSIEQVRYISLRKKDSPLKGAAIGLGIGALTGVILGLASGDDPTTPYPSASNDPFGFGSLVAALNIELAMTAGQKAGAGAIVFGTLGAITGAIISAVAKKKFIIGGKKEVYRDMESELMKRLITK